MTVLSKDDFETGNFNKWNQIRISPDTAVVAIDAVTPLRGKYSAKCSIPGLASGVQIAGLEWLGNWTTLYARALVRVDAFAPVEEGDRINPIVFVSADGVGIASVAIEMHNGVPTWTLRCTQKSPLYMTTPFEVGKVYCIEVSYHVAEAIELWIDGELQPLSHINPTTTPIATIRFGLAAATNLQNPSTATVDECAIGDSYIGPPPSPPPTPCFIATAAYGTSLAPELNVLRRFRDKCLPDRLVEFYYNASPRIADYIREHFNVKRVVRVGLDIVIRLLKHLL